jgi:hypothetical protein
MRVNQLYNILWWLIPWVNPGNTKGGSITVPLTSCLTGLESAVWQLIFFYLQNRLIQTSQTGGRQYNDTSPFSIPRLILLIKCGANLLTFIRQGWRNKSPTSFGRKTFAWQTFCRHGWCKIKVRGSKLQNILYLTCSAAGLNINTLNVFCHLKKVFEKHW